MPISRRPSRYKPSNIPSNTAIPSNIPSYTQLAAELVATWWRPPDGFVAQDDHLIPSERRPRSEEYPLCTLDQPLAALFWTSQTDVQSLAALASQVGWLYIKHRPGNEPIAQWRAAVREAKRLRLVLDFYEQPSLLKPYVFQGAFLARWDRAAGAWVPGVQNIFTEPCWIRNVAEGPISRTAAELFTDLVGKLLPDVRVSARIAEPAATVPVLAAESLLGIVALEVLALATGQRRYQLCAECGRWFDKTDLRADTLFHPECSKRRRMREYMRRRRQRQEETNE